MMNKFNIGDIAIVMKKVNFIDKTKHSVGQHIQIDPKNVDYFNNPVNFKFYAKVR